MSITEFADRVVLSGDPYVAVYCRVRVTNPTDRAVSADPDASPALVPLSVVPDTVAPHRIVQHDYVVATDRFGSDDPWPSAQALIGAGGFAQHFAHMRTFWNSQLAAIAHIGVPDHALVDAYDSGFITTQITRSGNDLEFGRKRLQQRVQPRRHRDPHQPLHPGFLHRRARAVDRGPQRRRRRRASTSTACGPFPCRGPCTC